MFDYKKRVLQARMGIFNFNRNKVTLGRNTYLPAAIISNSIFMYFLLMVIITIAS